MTATLLLLLWEFFPNGSNYALTILHAVEKQIINQLLIQIQEYKVLPNPLMSISELYLKLFRKTVTVSNSGNEDKTTNYVIRRILFHKYNFLLLYSVSRLMFELKGYKKLGMLTTEEE